MRIVKANSLLEHITNNSYPICQRNNSIEKGMTLTGIKQCIDEQAITLSRREIEVLNTTLSAEIMKMHLHYGKPARHDDSPDRLRILYSLRDKLIDAKELTTVGTTPDT